MAQDILAVMRDRAIARIANARNAKPEDVKVDPALLLAIFSAVLQLLAQCKKKDKDVNLQLAIQKPTMLQQLSLRQAIIKELGSRKEFRKNASEIMQALIEVGAGATPEEINTLLKQAGLTQ